MLHCKYLAFLCVMFFAGFGCSKWSANEVVDTDYLESSEYQSFLKKTNIEENKFIQQKKNFIKFTRTKIVTSAGKKIKLPALIDEEKIQASLKEDVVNRPSLITLLGYKQNYYPIAKAELREKDYYFFMTCKVAYYKDCLVWFASAKGDDLIHVEMISVYKKTHTYGETPTIEVTRSKLNIEINRYVKYPLSTLYTYDLQYDITKVGEIIRT